MDKVNSRREKLRTWLFAARPRTLMLAIASVTMGILLAAAEGDFDPLTAGLTILTAALLQVLSNLANDYGDSIHGADHVNRLGPVRAVQSGKIPARTMRRAIVIVALAAVVSGISLLWLALGAAGLVVLAVFLLLGGLAVWAAITYTAGRIPYGYAGLGDLAVLVFFGWVAVLGSFYLQTLDRHVGLLLPATSCGLFAVGVLNVNNIRDIDSDRLAGKLSIPVRLGLRGARHYHWFLLLTGILAGLIYVLINCASPWQFLFLLSIPMFVQNGRAVSGRPPAELNPYLGQLSMATLLFVLTFGVGQLIAA